LPALPTDCGLADKMLFLVYDIIIFAFSKYSYSHYIAVPAILWWQKGCNDFAKIMIFNEKTSE